MEGNRRVGRAGAMAGVIGSHPREAVAIFAGAMAGLAVFINALFMQTGPHPSPIFAPELSSEAVKKSPAPPLPMLDPGPLPASFPNVALPPADPRAAEKSQVVKTAPRSDPIAELLAPSKQVMAVQRALSELGYGQIKPTGQFGPETREAIEKFERWHKMPASGQISDRLVRALAGMTGRALE
jgi:hypothetical protein